MQGGRFAFTKFILISRGHSGHVGAFHAHGDLCRAATTTLWVSNSDSVGLCGLQRHGLGGLCIGVDYHIGRLPMEIEASCGAGTGVKGGCAAIDDCVGLGCCRGNRCCIYRHGLCLLVGAQSVAAGNRKRHLIIAGLGVGVCDALSCSRLSVAKVPLETLDLLSTRVGGGGAGELGRRAFANRSVGEVGRGLRIDYYSLSRGTVALATHSDSAGVLASHGHGAVRAGGILLVGSEATRAGPAVSGTSLPLSSQIDGFTHAIRAVSVDQGRKDAAVGAACTDVRK